ncbi:MAG: hypothetical protein ABII22_03475 [Candidatus Micrarchaeota archaeon]
MAEPIRRDPAMQRAAMMQQQKMAQQSPMADGPGAASLGMPPTGSNIAAYTGDGPGVLRMEGFMSRTFDTVTDGAKKFASGAIAVFSKKTARYKELDEHKGLAVNFVDSVTIAEVLTNIGDEGKAKLNGSIQADNLVDASLRSGIEGLDESKSYSLAEKALVLKKLFEDRELLKSSNIFEAIFEQGADKGVKMLVGLCVLWVALDETGKRTVGPIAEPKSLKEFIDSNAKVFLDQLKGADTSPKKAKFGELSKILQNERVSTVEELKRKVMDVYGRLPEGVDTLFEDLVYTVKYQPKNMERLNSLLTRFGVACIAASIEGMIVVTFDDPVVVDGPKNLHTVVTDAVARFPDNPEDRREYQGIVGSRLDKFKSVLLSERAQTQLAFVDSNPLAIFAAVKKPFEDQAGHLKIAEEQYDEEQKAAENYRGKNSLKDFFSTGTIGRFISYFKSDPKRPHPACAGTGQIEGKDCKCMKSAAQRGRQNFLRRRAEGTYYFVSRNPVFTFFSVAIASYVTAFGMHLPFSQRGRNGGITGILAEHKAIYSENQRRIQDLETEPKVKKLYAGLDDNSKGIWNKVKEDSDLYSYLLMTVFTNRYGTFDVNSVKKALESMDIESIKARLAQDPKNERVQLELETAEGLLVDMRTAGRKMAKTALDSFGKAAAKTESTVCFSCDDVELIGRELGMRQRVLESTTQVKAFLEFVGEYNKSVEEYNKANPSKTAQQMIELPKNVAVLVELEFEILNMLIRNVDEGQDAKTVLQTNLESIKAFIAPYPRLEAHQVPSYMQAKLAIQMRPFRNEDLNPFGAGGRLKRYSGMTKAESEQGSTQRLTRLHDLLTAVSIIPLEKPAEIAEGAAEGSLAGQKFAGNTKDGKLSLDAGQFEQLVSRTGLTRESIDNLVGVSQKLGYYFEYADVGDLSGKLAATAKSWPKDKETKVLVFNISDPRVVSGLGRALDYQNGKSLKKIGQQE